MSTRSNVLFRQGKDCYQLYAHWDGYPSGRLNELFEFVKWNGDRCSDLAYTVANYIFFVKANAMGWEFSNEDKNGDTNSHSHLGIGLIPICMANDPRFDALFIEWFYIVDLDKKTIEVIEPRYEIKGDWATNDREYIPIEPKKLGVFNFDCVLTSEQFEKLDQGKRITKKELLA